jgi:hypothetical protein
MKSPQTPCAMIGKTVFQNITRLLLSGSVTLVFSAHVTGQMQPSSFTILNQPPVSTYDVNGISGGGQGLTGSSFNMHYGQSGPGQPGINRVVQNFVVNGAQHTYIPVPATGGLPYSRIVVNQRALGVPNAEQNTEKETSFSESAPQAGSDLYLLPDHATTMEAVANSFVTNRGIDNAFANISGRTINTIERIDMILAEGVIGSDVNKSGFLVMERGGNDSFKAAAITGLNPDGTVQTLGSLVTITNGSWQSTGTSIQSVVLQKASAALDWNPTQLIGTQAIAGTYITLENLGVSSGVEIFGYALFPGDVTDEMDLIGLTDVPGNTPQSGTGGLDYMAGGGYFIALVNVAGNIFIDADGGTLNGIPTNAEGQIYVSLVKDGAVYATAKVADDGSYIFTNVEEDTYSAVIHTTPGGSVSPQLPIGNWVYTGEGVGPANPGTTPDETINGITQIIVGPSGTPDILNVNFGIQQTPAATAQEYTLAVDPDVDTEIILNGSGTGTPPNNVVPGPLSGSDPEDQPETGPLDGRQVVITVSPDNGELYYNNVLVASTDAPFTIGNYNPDLLKIRFTGRGYSSVTFSYAFVDANGQQSDEVTYTIKLPSALPVRLVDFVASREAGSVILTWSTVSETNSDRFEIEYSLDVKAWEKIGAVEASGESEAREDYQFTHNGFLSTVTGYYRLKMIDRDKTFAHSKILSMDGEGSDGFSVYPNPATTGIVRFDDSGKQIDEVAIYDQAGVLVASPKLVAQTIDLADLPRGIYILYVTYTNGGTATTKLVRP